MGLDIRDGQTDPSPQKRIGPLWFLWRWRFQWQQLKGESLRPFTCGMMYTSLYAWITQEHNHYSWWFTSFHKCFDMSHSKPEPPKHFFFSPFFILLSPSPTVTKNKNYSGFRETWSLQIPLLWFFITKSSIWRTPNLSCKFLKGKNLLGITIFISVWRIPLCD